MQAIYVWNTLSNGNGGLDWAGLPFVCEHVGITDIDALMSRLYVIRTHKPPEQT